MNTSSDRHIAGDLAGAVGYRETDGALPVATPWEAELYARAERRMRRGKQLVRGGFILAFVGTIAYCVITLSSGVNDWLGSVLSGISGWPVTLMLGLIGLGTLVWVIGTLLYLNGSMDAEPNESGFNLKMCILAEAPTFMRGHS